MGGDLGNGGKHVRRGRGRALHAVAMVDLSIAGLFVQIELIQIVVEIDVAGAQVSAQQSGVRREDGRNAQLPHPAQHQTAAGQPFVEMSDDIWFGQFRSWRRFDQLGVELLHEPGDQVAENDRVIGLAVVPRHADIAVVPEIVLPFVQFPVRAANIEQNDLRIAFLNETVRGGLGAKPEAVRLKASLPSISHLP